jgi:Zn-finger in ubiquitin-hydrolases and other protein
MDAIPAAGGVPPFVVVDAAGEPTGVTDPHIDQIRDVEPHTKAGCEDCLREGTTWVHLRLCLTCGHVGCCDSSPRRHARGHWHGSTHPIAQSFEPGEDWAWCFADEALLVPAG